ncbi:MAG TPA: MFS transporter [Thermomicrobiaceae bacterium]|nr:MFS transporter [Thermomicrobiaceae bacterium]
MPGTAHPAATLLRPTLFPRHSSPLEPFLCYIQRTGYCSREQSPGTPGTVLLARRAQKFAGATTEDETGPTNAAWTTGAGAGLARRTKLLWGTAGLGAEALRQSRGAWLVFFYAPPPGAGHAALLSLATVSVLLFAGKVLEALVDTLIGYWSDRTTSRLGRRLPFILLATPPSAVFAVLLFAPPVRTPGAVVAAGLFLTLELFYLFNSLVNVPYDALLPEIGRTEDERLSLSTWRVYSGVLGAGIGLVGSGLLVSRFGFRGMALALALLAVATRYAGVAGVWRRADREPPAAHPPLWTSLRQTAANRRLIVFMLSFVLFSTALAMLVGLLPYYVTSVLQEADTGTWSAILTAVGIGSMGLALPVFGRLARRSSQDHAYRRAMLAAAVAFPILFFAGSLPGIVPTAQALVALVIVGAPLAGVYLFPGPIVADLCDREARERGIRREGMFYSAQAFMDKVTEAFAPLLLGLLLLLGDRPGDTLGIRLVGPAAGLVVLVGYLALRAFGGNAVEPA